jgi:hypothetical protein
MNIESMFTWSGDSEEDRLSAINEEFKFLLLRMGWLLKDSGTDGKWSIQVNRVT